MTYFTQCWFLSINRVELGKAAFTFLFSNNACDSDYISVVLSGKQTLQFKQCDKNLNKNVFLFLQLHKKVIVRQRKNRS